MNKTKLLPLLCAASFANATESFSYSYVEARYWDQSSNIAEGDGYQATISYDIADGAFFQLQYSEGGLEELYGINLSVYNVEAEYQGLGLFIGGHGRSEKINSWGGCTFIFDNYSVSTPILKDDTDGYTAKLGGGLRYWLIRYVELNGGVEFFYTNASDLNINETDFLVSVGIRFQPIDQLSIGINGRRLLDLEVDEFGADIRYQF